MTLETAAKHAGITTALIRREIAQLASMGLVKSVAAPRAQTQGKGASGAHWMFDKDFKYARAVAFFVQETSPAEFKNIEQKLKGSGRFSAIILSGIFMGDLTRPADLLLAADSLNERRLEQALKELEPMFGREIRYATFSTPEFRYRLTVQDRLIRDTLDFPHKVLVNRVGLT